MRYDISPPWVLSYQIDTNDGRLCEGAIITQWFHLPLIKIKAFVRVIEVREEAHVTSVTYVTTTGHPECGVARFEVRRTPEGVEFTIETWSKPGSPLSRIGRPFVRWMQKRSTSKALELFCKNGDVRWYTANRRKTIFGLLVSAALATMVLMFIIAGSKHPIPISKSSIGLLIVVFVATFVIAQVQAIYEQYRTPTRIGMLDEHFSIDRSLFMRWPWITGWHMSSVHTLTIARRRYWKFQKHGDSSHPVEIQFYTRNRVWKRSWILLDNSEPHYRELVQYFADIDGVSFKKEVWVSRYKTKFVDVTKEEFLRVVDDESYLRQWYEDEVSR